MWLEVRRKQSYVEILKGSMAETNLAKKKGSGDDKVWHFLKFKILGVKKRIKKALF